MKQLLLFMGAILFAGCEGGMDSDQQARHAAEEWAEAYFNCDFKDASEYVTPESQKWLQYAASNTSAEELKQLQEAGGAKVIASEGFDKANDTMRLVTLNVTNSLKPKGQGTTEIITDATFKVEVVKREAGWLVRMAGLPRSEKQSRD